ncbi:hypothetical protein LEP1GSC163_2130 [Leptospira santarosai str. CBC379]|uniref:Uncharacterized protein n=1 Tax=Leptospira santarosai str. MOR084 TaxID=1049984 RepID=A0A0E2BJD3_9LEPT|nr:hypothetical protein LEP1GSC179_1269 [Leptospira santarosai str. MOR084]EKR92479.1 hypothetical protein LEP1GSC163_2130 [Leptospira santarosai str. CBC379]EMO83922.1 hypothetical protein LEP1GSC070_2380 [Leptospira santarosai str. AIM]
MFSRKNDDSENFLHRIHVFSTRKFRFSFYQNDSNRFFRKSHPEQNTSFFRNEWSYFISLFHKTKVEVISKYFSFV